MDKQTTIKIIKVESGQLLEQIKRLLHEGNVRRIIVKQEGRVVAVFPLTFGVVGVVIAPALAAVSTLAALLAHCTLELARFDDTPIGIAYPVMNGHMQS